MSKFIFLGNRPTIIDVFKDLKYNDFKIIALKNSVLGGQLKKENRDFIELDNRLDLIPILKDINFKILLCAGWPYQIETEVLSDKVLINFHPSLLPQFPGRHAITQSLEKGGPYGVTAHFMDEDLDTGKIIGQLLFKPSIIPSADFLYYSLFALERVLIKNVAVDILSGNGVRELKKEFFFRDVDYYSSDWKKPTKEINSKVNTIPLSHGDFKFFTLNKEIRIKKSWIITCDSFDLMFPNLTYGEAVEFNGGFLFKGVDGWLYFE